MYYRISFLSKGGKYDVQALQPTGSDVGNPARHRRGRNHHQAQAAG